MLVSGGVDLGLVGVVEYADILSGFWFTQRFVFLEAMMSDVLF